MKLPVQSVPVERSLVTTDKADVDGIEASTLFDDLTKQFPCMFGSTNMMNPQNIFTSFVPLLGTTF
ncbi:MAG: hypothetical protein Kow00121_19970 [Elainellaceae cyanobacterium]